MNIENINLTEELILKASECKTSEELVALAHENGIEITPEQLSELMAEITKKCSGELSDEALELEGAVGGVWDPFSYDNMWDPYKKKTVSPTGMCNHYNCRVCGTIFRKGSYGGCLDHLWECKNDRTSCCKDCRFVVAMGGVLFCGRGPGD